MRQEQRSKRRKRASLLQVGAIAVSFGLGIGTSWWVTDGSTADANSTATAESNSTPESTDETVNPLATLNAQPDPSPSLSDEFPNPLITLTEDDIPKTGSGTFLIASGESAATGPNPTKYRVEVEEDLPFDVEETAAFVDETLADPRGWGAEGKHAFQRVSDDSYDFRIVIATPDTVDELCTPLRTNGKVSCGRDGRATLNGLRWAVGVESFGDDIDNYRRYLVAHEFGHLLGYQHEKCPAPGELAPVMVQQTHSTQGCEPNPWPFPNAKAD